MIARQIVKPLCLALAAASFSCAPSGRLIPKRLSLQRPKPEIPPGWAEAIRARSKHRPLNIAHRGARSLAPENTIAALRAALDVGADGWEIDIHPTRDGRLVVIHDDTLDRTTNAREVFPDRKPWYVADFTLDEIRQLDAGSWFVKSDPFQQIKDGAVSRDAAKAFIGEKVPTLEEVLRFTRESGKLIDVEIKQMPRRYPDVVEQVVAAIRAEGLRDRAAISCFDHSCVLQVKSLDRKLMAGPIANDRIGRPAKYVGTLLGAEACFLSGSFVGAGSLAFAGSALTQGSFRAKDLNLEDLRSLRKAGIAVFVWTINDEKTMRGLMEADVTGIITDFPQRLQKLKAED